MAEDEDPDIISRIERKRADTREQGLHTDMDYTKYAVGGEWKEVPPSSGSDENDNFFQTRQCSQPKQKDSRSKK